MSLRRFLLAPALVALGACSTDPGNSAPDDGAGSAGKTASAGSSSGGPSNSRGSRPKAQSGDDADLASDAGGGGGEPDDVTPPAADTPVHPSCELDDTCTSQCEDEEVTCGVNSTGVACEFEGFAGATAPVTCGERVIVGTACCGGCGCVPVELFFDGEHCWQGIPSCELPEFNGRLFDPHPTTAPNPSFVPDGPFHLGEGGFGSDEGPQNTAGGTTGAGGASPGNDAGNAPSTGAEAGAGGAGGANAGGCSDGVGAGDGEDCGDTAAAGAGGEGGSAEGGEDAPSGGAGN
jgi:hypothetical protein